MTSHAASWPESPGKDVTFRPNCRMASPCRWTTFVCYCRPFFEELLFCGLRTHSSPDEVQFLCILLKQWSSLFLSIRTTCIPWDVKLHVRGGSNFFFLELFFSFFLSLLRQTRETDATTPIAPTSHSCCWFLSFDQILVVHIAFK